MFPSRRRWASPIDQPEATGPCPAASEAQRRLPGGHACVVRRSVQIFFYFFLFFFLIGVDHKPDNGIVDYVSKALTQHETKGTK